jgi:hypothetical protein
MTRNRSSPIKRRRRSKSEIDTVKEALRDAALYNSPATVRQIFYQLVSSGVIAKTEAEYKTTVCRLLVEMRRDGDIPYEWIADNSRWMRKPESFDNIQAALEDSVTYYRRSLWRDADVYVEVWLEKEALAGVLYPVTSEWDVPLMVTRGYPSLSFLYEAASVIKRISKPSYLYYLGDHDPSGVDIPRYVEEQIRELAPYADISFKRVAVTPEQIEEYDLPTRPTKKSDSRARNFEGESVEVDAINASELREIVRDCITEHIDEGLLERTAEIEKAERESASAYLTSLNDALGKSSQDAPT